MDGQATLYVCVAKARLQQSNAHRSRSGERHSTAGEKKPKKSKKVDREFMEICFVCDD